MALSNWGTTLRLTQCCNDSLDGTNVRWRKTKWARTVVYVKNGRIDPTSVARSVLLHAIMPQLIWGKNT